MAIAPVAAPDGVNSLTYQIRSRCLRQIYSQNFHSYVLGKIYSFTTTQNIYPRALDLIKQYGHSSLAHFCLLPDKSYYFAPSGKTVIAYVPKGRGAIALGDPIGAPEDLKDAIIGYVNSTLLCGERSRYHNIIITQGKAASKLTSDCFFLL